MDNIFKFVSLRPAQQTEPTTLESRFARYSQDAKSPLHQQIEELAGENRRAQAIRLALDYMDSDAYQGEGHVIAGAAQQASKAENVAAATQAAAHVLGVDELAAYLQSEEVGVLRDQLWDSLYAQTLAPDVRPNDRDAIYASVRGLHYLALLIAQDKDETPWSPAMLAAITPILPSGIVPSADPPDDDSGTGEVIENIIKNLKAVYNRVSEKKAAIDDLLNVDRLYWDQLQRNYPGANLDFSASNQTETEITLNPLLNAVLRVPPRDVDSPPDGPVVVHAETVDGAPLSETRSIIMPHKPAWIYDEFGQNNLKDSTKDLLQFQQNVLKAKDTAELVGSLEADMSTDLVAFLEILPERALPYVVEREEFRALAELVPVPLSPVKPVKPDPFPALESPAARGIRPLGIGDLLIVQQNLIGYAPGEIAHIENILKSEHKTRTHARMRETEEILVLETEEIEESERDLQSTQRFELQTETERTIESQMSVEAGLSVTASYGFVSATATANFAYNQSLSQSNRVATQFAKEVVERSVSRITQRVREERTRRTLERFEETNEHGFDNRQGSGHVIGVYRWVDKYYKARIVNYGRRLMMEFIVPEPAAFYIYTQNKRELKGVTATRPEEPTIWNRRLRPDDLTSYNYQKYVAAYNVQDVDPYPATTTRVGAAFAEAPGTGGDKNVAYATTSEKLKVPDGYVATDVWGLMSYQGIKGTNYFFDCYVAGQPWGSITAFGLGNIIPMSAKGWITAFHVNLVAECRLTPEALAAWQLKTFRAIISGYEQALADYNEQVAAAEIAAGVEIQGRNPELNRKVEREELKKGALRLLTDEYARTRVDGNWRYNEQFDAMKPSGAFGYPAFDVDEALVEGQMIQFFEQAFEWNNITYRFYPYFWGRKGNWQDTLLYDDTDPQFTDFLRSGAARVIVPVHPAYGEAILHYLYTNEIWNGDQPPTLDDPLYVSIVDELKSDTGADINRPLPDCSEELGYPCVVDEWDVKVPTNLVYLQPSSALPGFGVVDEDNGAVTGEEYIVQRGDTWRAIARNFGITVTELQQANPHSVRPGQVLYRGERLLIPKRA